MKVCVLISCMNQDRSIVERTNVQTNCVVINQCDSDVIEEYDFKNSKDERCHVKFISTTERGLSRSRNMAIANCEDDICLICDDDERLADNYENLISDGYQEFPEASVVAFSLVREDCNRTYPTKKYKVKFFDVFRINSVQITFKRTAIQGNHIMFDTQLGSGTGNGGGEENKFLLDCYKSKLKMYYHTNCIATVIPHTDGGSLWFHGYNAEYLEKLGWSSRRILGNFLGGIYGLYFVFTHYKKFKDSLSLMGALKALMKGWIITN